MDAVNTRIQSSLHSDVPLVNEVGRYIVSAGGKRLRPILVLLSAGAFDYQGRAHIDLAAIIEFIHTATLLHDDVVDESLLRRGQETANAIWGNEASVLVGDFLYSRAFQMMVEVGSMRIMEMMADTTNLIAEGEVLQLLNCHDPDTTEQRYLDVVRAKTAALFEAACTIGPVLAARSTIDERHMTNFGRQLGVAFQLIDDVLDYQGSADDIGKNIGDDLAEGKPTLPLIHALRTGTAAQTMVIREAILNGDAGNIETVVEIVESTGGIAYTARAARDAADGALGVLEEVPPSTYRDALAELAEFSVSRRF
ncbi:MAG: polyprenyl synthetase family protein [Pseudomonadota bacterium]